MRKGEAEYWKNEFPSASNSKEFWKVVKKVHRKTKVTKIGPLEDDQGNVQTNETVKAELMNNYFVKLVKNWRKHFLQK